MPDENGYIKFNCEWIKEDPLPEKSIKGFIVMRSFNVLVEQDEDGWFISEVLELSGCHTQAKTLEGLMNRTKEAINLCLKTNGYR